MYLLLNLRGNFSFNLPFVHPRASSSPAICLRISLVGSSRGNQWCHQSFYSYAACESKNKTAQGKITQIFWFPHRQERSESRLNWKATAMSSKGLLIMFPNAYSRSVLLFLIITLKFLISYWAESAVSVSSHLNQEMPNSFYFWPERSQVGAKMCFAFDWVCH